jgi:hypothetical protein
VARSGFTLEGLAARERRLGLGASALRPARVAPAVLVAAKPARGRAPQRMNGLEADYARLLELRVRAGEVLWWSFEGFRLRLAEGAWFTPDFVVLLATGVLEFHETKGFLREAARVRLRVAAGMYPWGFVLVRRGKGGGGWSFERVAS